MTRYDFYLLLGNIWCVGIMSAHGTVGRISATVVAIAWFTLSFLAAKDRA
jgi:hypothetical protein